MLAKLRQSEGAQGFIYFMYNLLEMLGKVMEFMLPSESAVHGNSQRLLPVHALNPLIRMRVDRRRWASRDLIALRTYPSSQSSKVSIPEKSVLGVAP